jgi:hypothetical protein
VSERRRFKSAEGRTFDASSSGTCPTCHRTVWFLEMPEMGIAHEQPFCTAFELLETAEHFADYAAAIRKYGEDKADLQRAAKSERMPRA